MATRTRPNLHLTANAAVCSKRAFFLRARIKQVCVEALRLKKIRLQIGPDRNLYNAVPSRHRFHSSMALIESGRFSEVSVAKSSAQVTAHARRQRAQT